MRNIHDPGEYHKYQNTSGGSDNGDSGGSSGGPGCGGWIIIGIVVFMLISFISNCASWEAIETLLALGLIAFLLARWLFS